MEHDDRFSELLASHQALTSTPEAWFEVARGLRSPQEAAHAVVDDEEPALIERSMVLFAPASEQRQRELRARILDTVAPERPSSWWGFGALAVAAGLLLALMMRPTEPDGPAPTGVRYEVELSAAHEPMRGRPPALATSAHHIDQTMTFTLRPVDEVDASVLDVLMLAFDERGHGVRVGALRRLPTTTGTVRITERLDRIGLSPGVWRLVFVVGSVGSVPEGPERYEPGAPIPKGSSVASAELRVLGEDER